MGGKIILVPGDQTYFAIRDERDCAIAVPFDLKEPLGIVERLLDRCGQHGIDTVGIGLSGSPSRDSSAEIAEDPVFLSFLAVVEDIELSIEGLGRFVFSFYCPLSVLCVQFFFLLCFRDCFS